MAHGLRLGEVTALFREVQVRDDGGDHASQALDAEEQEEDPSKVTTNLDGQIRNLN